MTAAAVGTLRPDRSTVEHALYPSISRHGDRTVVFIALGIAVAVHTAFLSLHLPPRTAPPVEPLTEPIIWVNPPDLLPPPLERPTVELRPVVRRVPVPDTAPPPSEPIFEDPADLGVAVAVGDVEITDLFAVPQPPPPSGPKLPGRDGVSAPVLVEETKVPPHYPEIARLARRGGDVILRAVIRSDGSVGEIEILKCDPPNLGFEEAALRAVAQWHYEPAMQRDRPVDVYFTVHVSFVLQ